MLNNGLGIFSLSSSPTVGLSPRSVVAADFNGDGKPDVGLSVTKRIRTLFCQGKKS